MDRETAALCTSMLKADVRALRDRCTALHGVLGLTDWVPGTEDTAFADVCAARDKLFEVWSLLRSAETKLTAKGDRP